MLELGQIFCSKEATGDVYYIVIETGRRMLFEKVEDYITRNYVVSDPDTGNFYTIKNIIEQEKDKLIRAGKVRLDVYDN
jgi:hypothetical protein